MTYRIANDTGTQEETKAFIEFLLLKAQEQQEEAKRWKYIAENQVIKQEIPVCSEFTMKAIEKRAEAFLHEEQEAAELLNELGDAVDRAAHILGRMQAVKA